MLESRVAYMRIDFRFYHAMHIVLARYCYHMSLFRLSAREADVSWAYRLD